MHENRSPEVGYDGMTAKVPSGLRHPTAKRYIAKNVPNEML